MNEKTNVKILLANDRGLLEEGARAVISTAIESGELTDTELPEGRRPTDPAKLRAAVESIRAADQCTVVVLLLDPIGPLWLEAAKEIRLDERVAILALVARPNYAVQRMWRRTAANGRYLATGMLALNSARDSLLPALRAAAANTAEIGDWLVRDNDDVRVARHPTALLASVPEDVAEGITQIQKKPALYKALVLSSQLPRDEVIDALAVTDGTYTSQKKELRKLLGVDTDMQLILKAYEYGLVGDAGPEWSETSE